MERNQYLTKIIEQNQKIGANWGFCSPVFWGIWNYGTKGYVPETRVPEMCFTYVPKTRVLHPQWWAPIPILLPYYSHENPQKPHGTIIWNEGLISP